MGAALRGGDWSATLGISEADAGSDVGRIRTRAVQDPEGGWRITGEKMWTSFGDNDIVERIGHLVLARTPDAPPGSAGLSLFLVPNLLRNAQGAGLQMASSCGASRRSWGCMVRPPAPWGSRMRRPT